MLDRIVAAKRQEVKRLSAAPGVFETASPFKARLFAQALINRSNRVALIAEVKKASPSRGLLAPNFDPEALAVAYALNGAAAISVLTDTEFFQGRPEYLSAIKQKVDLPLLRKDFILDEIQLYQSLVIGADAVLLIAAILEHPQLLKLVELTQKLGMEPLVEIHDQQELAKALDTPARVIGVNNRNLANFEVSLATSFELAPFIPDKIIKVSESGIQKPGDLALLQAHGYSAALVGEALVTASDMPYKLRQLSGYEG
jgi:indole-3-glycerol phosphate synthase